MELPSKELLSEVLVKNVKMIITDIKVIHGQLNSSIKNSEIAILYDDTWTYENIYELMHMMKEWAKKEGYELHSGYNGDIDVYECVISEMYEEDGVRCESSYREELGNSTEFEVVSDCCQWILKEYQPELPLIKWE